MARELGYLYDSGWVMKTSGAITSSAAVATIIDTGSATAKIRGDLVIEVTALDIASNDEVYDVVLQASPDSDFGTDTNIQDLLSLTIAAAEVQRSDCNKDGTIGRYVLPFSNEAAGTVYRYLRLYTIVAGTTPSITYSARASVMKCH